MSNFQGISLDGMFLLAENRFRDSKSFYEEQKPQIKKLVLDPLRDLAEDLAGPMLAVDSRIITDPNRNGCISRIRRDNRYTHDKSMYRENVWVGFMRDKKAFVCAPGFFADMSAKGSTYGMGFYYATPRLMQTVRRMIDERPGPWTKALRQAEAAGFAPYGDRYARPKKEGLSPLLDGVYNRKTVGMERFDPDPAFFGSAALVESLQQAFTALIPLYRLLIAAVERDVEQGIGCADASANTPAAYVAGDSAF